MKTFLFSILYFILCIPFLQKSFHIFTLKKLDGVELKQEVDSTKQVSWFEGTLQQEEEKKVNDSIGMREFLIRLYNQVDFTLFHNSNSPGVVVGKDNFLYLTSYIENYSGKNFIGWRRVATNVRRLKMLQESLKKKNIQLIVILAPGKASFYPEYINRNGFAVETNTSNYVAYKRLFQNTDVDFIDLQSWFNELKNKTPYKLYPKYGVHWNYYGSYLASDTIKKYIEQVYGYNLSEIKLENVNLSDSLQSPDYDAGDLLNIFTKMKDTMPYPKLIFQEKSEQEKPAGLLISDSYGWLLYDQKFLKPEFKDWSYWFYNKKIYPESDSQLLTTSQINYTEVLKSKDVILLMTSEGTMDLFPYDILEKAEKLYLPETLEELSDYYKMKIYDDKDWLHTIVLKTIENKKSLEQAIQDESDWMANENLNTMHLSVDGYEKKIRGNPEWMKNIIEKAHANNITVDEMVKRDAEWLVKEDEKKNK